MEESFEFSAAERIDSDQWQLGATSVLSVDSGTSMFYQKNYNLHLIQKKETLSERKIIPSTKAERLSYFRAYVTSMNKTQIICMQHERFHTFLWYYVFTTIFKSLPHTYSCIFLASYSSDEHLFLPKMVPFSVGFKFVSIVAGIFELLAFTDSALYMIDYIYNGIFFKNPWNRCYSWPVSDFYKNNNVTWKCYNLYEFTQKIKEIVNRNETLKFVDFYYQDSKETFQLAQIEYYRGRSFYFSSLQIGSIVYFCIIWISAARFHKNVYKKWFWKVLNKVQWSVNAIDLISFIYVLVSYLNVEYKISDMSIDGDDHTSEYTDLIWEADVDMLAESTTSPPVVHILTARGLGEIEPSYDSAVMIMSNALLYIFRGILHYRVKSHCESMMGVPIFLTVYNQHSWFYVWPLFFSKFYMGDIFTLIFLFVNIVMEFLTIIVTYHCIIEVIVCEYKQIGKYVAVSLTLVAIGTFIVTDADARVLLWIYSTGIATLIEILVLYCMYPVGRLVDDITFHYGFPPTKLRILSLQIVPIYYSIKFYKMFTPFIQIMLSIDPEYILPIYTWSWSLIVLLFVLGAFYQTYVYVVKYKREWKYMFRPSPTWGPRDYVSRDLRKQYDSRTYIGSQAPIGLARDLLSKTESKAYRLDVRYDATSRRSTMPTVDFQRDNSTKTFERRKAQDKRTIQERKNVN